MTSSPSAGLRTAFYRSGERRVSGFVVDISNLSQKFAVEILVDSYPVHVIRSDAFVHQLLNEQIGDACYGFSCVLQ